MPLTTANDMLEFVLRATGLLGVGQSALPEDFRDSMSAFNAMIGTWNANRCYIYHLIDSSLVSTGAKTYSVGPGQDFNVDRQDRLESGFFRLLNAPAGQQVDSRMAILRSREDWNQIATKSLGTFPGSVFLDTGYPVGTLYPWPVPPAGLYEIHLSFKAHLKRFESYQQQINLPEEYFEPLWSNLAVRVAALYPGASISDDTRKLATSSLATLAMANSQVPALRMPPGLPGLHRGYNNFPSGNFQ